MDPANHYQTMQQTTGYAQQPMAQQPLPPQPVVTHAPPPVQPLQTQPSHSFEESKKANMGKVKGIIQFVFTFFEITLAIRFVLLLLGSRTSDFAVLIINLTDPLVAPFRGTFSTPHVSISYFDITAILAMIIYAMISWGISQLVEVLFNNR